MVTQQEVMDLVTRCVLRKSVTDVETADMAEKRLDLTLAIGEAFGGLSGFRELPSGTEMPEVVASSYETLKNSYERLQQKTDREIMKLI